MQLILLWLDTNWQTVHKITHQTPQDHSLNTYGIAPHAAVKQPIYKNSWRWTCKCPKHVEAIYEKKS